MAAVLWVYVIFELALIGGNSHNDSREAKIDDVRAASERPAAVTHDSIADRWDPDHRSAQRIPWAGGRARVRYNKQHL